MNTRVNMLYFIEVLCDHSLKADYGGYTDMIRRDILQVVDAVVPNNSEGAANVGTVRKVMQNLQGKGFVNEISMEEITALLAEREREHRGSVASPEESVYDDDDEEPGNEGKDIKRKLDDSIIQQRMEEDRERHKRLRENIWAIPPPSDGLPNPEFEKAWDQVSDLNEDDYEIMREENQILAASVV